MLAYIPYSGEATQLCVLLTLLQPQLSSKDDIYILDTTPERSGLDIAKLYGSTRSYIFVEVAEELSLIPGIEYMIQNRHGGMLVIKPNTVISKTFISNLKRASKESYDVFCFHTTENTYLDPNFKWYTPLPRIEPVGLIRNDPVYMKRVVKNHPQKIGNIFTEHVVKLI